MGESFGNYELVRKLATGGMAEVFLARHQSLGGFERLLCIKRILPHLSQQTEFISMFQDEARIAANLIHPNIAQIYDIGEIDNNYYIALEYVNGRDIRQIYNQEVRRGRAVPLEPAAQIIMGAAAGLAHAHRQTTLHGVPMGIVHRDISPQNILVTYNGHVKVIDFGVAKAANKIQVTRAGVIKGKYSYMSPEHASGDPIDGRTDIFALGVTLYEITTGTRLFKRENELETLAAVIECDVTPPSQFLPGFDPFLEAIILRCLSFEYTERYEDATALERDLEQFLVSQSHPTTPSALGDYMQDLFADKLLDEQMLGGPLWTEEHTAAQNTDAKKTRRLTPEPTAGTAVDNDTTFVERPPKKPPVLQPISPNDEPTVLRGAHQQRLAAPGPKSALLLYVTAALALAILSGVFIAHRFNRAPAPPPQALAPQSGKLTLLSAPPGAAITLNGEPLPQTTPLTDHVLDAPRRYVITVSKQGHLPQTRALRLTPDTAEVLKFTLVPHRVPARQPRPKKPTVAPAKKTAIGKLSVSSSIPLTVRVDGKARGPTPLTALSLPVGEHIVELTSPLHGGVITRRLFITRGQTHTEHIAPQKGTLSVNAQPWARIQIQPSSKTTETPTQLELFEGRYSLVFICPNGAERVTHAVVIAGQTETVVMDCR